jgi:hypothetical protein
MATITRSDILFIGSRPQYIIACSKPYKSADMTTVVTICASNVFMTLGALVIERAVTYTTLTTANNNERSLKISFKKPYVGY